MFAKLKKKIEEESEHGIVSSTSAFPERRRFGSTSSLSNSIPDLHSKAGKPKENEKIKSLVEENGEKNISKIEKSANVVHHNGNKVNVSPEPKEDLEFQEREYKDELNDFQKQELAKVKHLLLICEKNLNSSEELVKKHKFEIEDGESIVRSLTNKLDDLRNEGDEKVKMVLKLESVVEKLTESNTQMIDQLEEREQKVKSLESKVKAEAALKEEEAISESQKSELLKEKILLMSEVDQLKKNNAQSCDKVSHLESIINDRMDEYHALKHTHDTYRMKTSSMLEDKDVTIKNMEERLDILEKRANNNGLSNDERIQSLIQERNQFEQLLNESRHQLSNIKLNWSEKINNLENQIANLNKKMAEDSEDSLRLEKQYDKLVEENKCAVTELDFLKIKSAALSIVEREYESIKDEFHTGRIERNRLRKENEALQTNMRSLRNEFNECSEVKKQEGIQSKNQIDQLMSQQSECLEKEIEVEKKISEYHDLIKKLKNEVSGFESENSTLKTKLKHANELCETNKKEIENLDINMAEKSRICEENQFTLDSLETELDNMQQERDNLLLRNSELSQNCEMIRQELNEERLSKERLQNEHQENCQESERIMKEINAKMKTLEAAVVHNVENSERFAELKTSIIDLESQLAEKNKVIKLQQQRISDMRKTLQKELKVQTPDNDSVGDGLDIGRLGIYPISKPNSKNLKKLYAIVPTNCPDGPEAYENVNIQYLRHVVFKFMTCREYEAQQLIKAISVLLKFTKEQENTIRDTLSWKMSWFGQKPEIRRSCLK